jgi:hypothetical protein
MRPHAASDGRRLRVAAGTATVVATLVLMILAPALARQPELAPAAAEPKPQTQPETQPEPQPVASPGEDPQDGQDREAIVTLRDGQRYSGMLVSKTPEQIVLRISGITMPIKMRLVDRVNVLPPVQELYRQMRSAIDDNDADRLLLLAEWLRAREQWSLALLEVDHIIQIQPGNADARRLRLLVESQKTLAEKAKAPKANPPQPTQGPDVPASPTPANASPTPAAGEDFPLLSDRDINIIKVYEVDLANPPRMVIDHDTVTRLIQEHAGDPLIPPTVAGRESLYRLPPARILELMFKMQARNLYEEVRVIDHPASLKTFRDTMYKTWIINSCATTRCHGGTEAGRLRLDSRRAGADQVMYTNFLILDRFKLADGQPLIDYDQPGKSPLIHMALPRDVALTPHPVVSGTEGRGDLWRPFFRSVEDRPFTQAVAWITSMYRPRPQYPIDLAPPPPPSAGPPAPPVTR